MIKVDMRDGRYLVKPIAAPIYLPSPEGTTTCTGEIVFAPKTQYLGPNMVECPVHYKVGEKIAFGAFSFTKIIIEAETYFIMREGDIYFAFTQ